MNLAKPKRESEEQNNAFIAYYQMGDNRSLDALAKLLKKPRSTLSRWSTDFEWQRRVAELEYSVAKATETQMKKSIVQDRMAYRSLIKRAIQSFADQLDYTDLKVTSVKDLERLMQLDFILMDKIEQTDKNNENTETQSNESSEQKDNSTVVNFIINKKE